MRPHAVLGQDEGAPRCHGHVVGAVEIEVVQRRERAFALGHGLCGKYVTSAIVSSE
jgi:hypothetical protein